MFRIFKKSIAGAFLGLTALVLSVSLVGAQEAGPGDAFTDGPSVFCHVTDGVFTDCEVNNGVEEWSDITPSFFDVFADVPGPESALYVDQADLDPVRKTSESEVDTLMLMYDEMFRTTPLLTGESVHVHFMTVDEGALVHYDVWIDTSGIQKVEINGVEQVPMPSGLKGVAGYGSSPNNPLPHVMAELQIGLEAAGFTSEECCYSPDPAWWGSSVPGEPQEGCPEDKDCDGVPDSQDPCPGTPGVNCLPPEPCPNDLDCDGVPDRDDQCPLEPGGINNNLVNDGQGCPHPQQKPGEEEETTAGIFTAHLNGKTTVDPEPLLPVGEEPPLCDSIKRIVEFRAIDTEILSLQLVGSQVDAGLISAEEGRRVLACVLDTEGKEGRMTGGGSVISKAVGRVTHGFELHCDATQIPNRLQVNWGGNRFHLESLTHAFCFDSPLIAPNPPAAGFDTYVGKGLGRYNGVSGYIARWVFRDAGEPGKNDSLKLVIIDPITLLPVLAVGGNLNVGNHQAHAH